MIHFISSSSKLQGRIILQGGDQHPSIAARRSSSEVRYMKLRSGNDMIVIKDEAVPKEIADAACRSLDIEVARKREEGELEAGVKSQHLLKKTTEILALENAFQDVCIHHEPNSHILSTLRLGMHLSHVSVLTPETYLFGVIR